MLFIGFTCAVTQQGVFAHCVELNDVAARPVPVALDELRTVGRDGDVPADVAHAWRGSIRGVRALPEGFTEDKLFHDYLRVRRSNPEKRVSMSEYMIFGFYGLTTAQQKQYLTDVEATLLMRPYNSIAEPYLKSKVTFLKNFTQFVSRGWADYPSYTDDGVCLCSPACFCFQDFGRDHAGSDYKRHRARR